MLIAGALDNLEPDELKRIGVMWVDEVEERATELAREIELGNLSLNETVEKLNSFTDYAPLAQLARAPGFDFGGCRFESYGARQVWRLVNGRGYRRHEEKAKHEGSGGPATAHRRDG